MYTKQWEDAKLKYPDNIYSLRSPRTKKKVKHPLIYWIITRYHEFSLEANIDFNKTCEKMGS
jgi:hypothetical protein